ncbi:MAG: Glu-tRNA(Gln) amidotransferase subunit GatD [Candidatus Thermoplasmatota archaeon]|nr:Glu-tRNA(Gln) amidotransferase subunit GatD [Candidatus Thermoplasmatota archaeon]
MLREARAEEGDRIEVASKFGNVKGVLMPKTASTSDDVITLKLDNGYNVGIAVKEDTEVRLIEKKHTSSKPAHAKTEASGKPIVAILGTGGTIASFVDYRSGAVHPAVSPEDLAASVPQISELCNIRTKMLFSMLSEDMQPEHWRKIAHEAANELNSGARAVIIPHGTDTLGFTAAALSFMLKNLTGPVILVGAQRSSDRPSSDAEMNLLSAVKVAIESDIGEVVAVMHDSTSDDRCAIHRGCKVRKMHTSRRDAFQTINGEPIGYVETGKISMAGQYRKKADSGQVEVDDKMDDENISMILSYPGLGAEHIKDVVIDGTVLVGTGLGHVSNRILPAIKQVIARGAFVVMASQCVNGRVNMNVYSTGRDLLDLGVVSAQDMTPEAAYVKLMWVLGHTKDRKEVKRLMATNLVGELTE